MTSRTPRVSPSVRPAGVRCGSVTHVQPTRARRLVTILAVAGAAAALAGCGTNTNALTQQWYDATDGANNDVEMTLEGLAIRSVVVVSDGSDATVVGTFVNDGAEADGVTGITVEGRPATITGDLDIAPGAAVRLGPPGEARALVAGAGLEPGSLANVEIMFDSAPQAELSAVVRAPEAEFAESGPDSATDSESVTSEEPDADAAETADSDSE